MEQEEKRENEKNLLLLQVILDGCTLAMRDVKELVGNNSRNIIGVNTYCAYVLKHSSSHELKTKCYQMLKNIDDIYEIDIMTIYNLALYSYHLHRYQDAYDYFQQLDELAPRNPITHFGASCTLEKMKKVEFLQGYLEVDPSHARLCETSPKSETLMSEWRTISFTRPISKSPKACSRSPTASLQTIRKC